MYTLRMRPRAPHLGGVNLSVAPTFILSRVGSVFALASGIWCTRHHVFYH